MYSRAITFIFTRGLRIQRKSVVIHGKSQINENFDERSTTRSNEPDDPFAFTIAKGSKKLKPIIQEPTGERKPRRYWEKRKPTSIETSPLESYGFEGALTVPVTADNQYTRLQQCVTPLSEVPYERQLKLKFNFAKNFLAKLSHRLKGEGQEIYLGKNSMRLQDIQPSPELFAYRNKDEFSIHRGVDGNRKTVGYFVGLSKDPLMRCVPPTYLINIKDSHKLVAKHFQTYIRNSPYETCTNFQNGGVWRTITVRSNSIGDIMAIVNIFPDDMTDSKKDDIKDSLKKFFFEGEGAECNLTSLYLQVCPRTRCSHEEAPYELIEGKPHIEESCSGANFTISPESFFQINTGAAEILYRSIQEVSEMSPMTTLLDVCCGAGPVSIICAPNVRGTIGIDSSSTAIEDAIRNATNNNRPNCTFHTAEVEKLIPVLGPSLNHCSDIIAIVNPARGGLHPAAVQSLRECEVINKIIYVTCKPHGIAFHNFIQLMTIKDTYKRWSKKTKGKFLKSDPFMPRYTIPVDMFPHTKHLELVVLFERTQDLGGLDVF